MAERESYCNVQGSIVKKKKLQSSTREKRFFRVSLETFEFLRFHETKIHLLDDYAKKQADGVSSKWKLRVLKRD